MGNKIDLRNDYEPPNTDPKKAHIKREIARKVIEDELHAKYIECSALTQ